MKTFFDFSERYGGRAGGYRDLMREQVRHVLFQQGASVLFGG